MDTTLGTFRCPFDFWHPSDGRLFDRFAFDTETTDIDEERPYLTPCYILGAASDGRRGVFVSRDDLPPFFKAHQSAAIIYHNAAFDLKVINAVLRPTLDVYQDVENGLVWDTMILKRLHSLATAGHTARGTAGLAACALEHLGVSLQKAQTDSEGKTVRMGFSQFLGKPPTVIPAQYLTYLAHDAIATWHLFGELHRLIRDVLRGAGSVYGYAGDEWLRDVIRRFGPLTHHIQLRASIVMDALRSTGIGIDKQRSAEKAAKVQDLLLECKERMRLSGFLVDQPGNGKAMQSILNQFHRAHPEVELQRTASEEKWSTAEEDLAELAQQDDFFATYTHYRQAQKLLSTYLRKMGPARLHPRFGYLLATGRTYCDGGFNLQNLPKEKVEKRAAATIRGCFVPAQGNVFIDCDYSQIELVVLGHVLEKQLGLPSQLARMINDGQDVHRLIAAAVLGKDPSTITKTERDSAKPVSFGRPGGMGATRLQGIAKSSYGLALSEDEVKQRIQAYHELCPELTAFLTDEVNQGTVLSVVLRMTPLAYWKAQSCYCDSNDPNNHVPEGWLGGMLLKVLRDPSPTTRGGRSYTPAEIDYFWSAAQKLPIQLEPELMIMLRSRQPGPKLWDAVRTWAGRRPVFTITGRLRANATFCSSRNCLFQGAAADGAILALWLVWRAGYKLVDFVHDQLVVEAPDDGRTKERIEHIESLMKQGMLTVVPGMNVKVETVITRSLNKADTVSSGPNESPKG